MKPPLIKIIALLALSGCLHAADYYVDPVNGNI